MNDEQLDRLFQEAEQQFEPPTAPKGSWELFFKNHLEYIAQRNDFRKEVVPENKKQWFWFFNGFRGKLAYSLMALGVLLLAGFGIYMYKFSGQPLQHSRNGNPVVQSNNANTGVQPEGRSVTGNLEDKHNLIEPVTKAKERPSIGIAEIMGKAGSGAKTVDLERQFLENRANMNRTMHLIVQSSLERERKYNRKIALVALKRLTPSLSINPTKDRVAVNNNYPRQQLNHTGENGKVQIQKFDNRKPMESTVAKTRSAPDRSLQDWTEMSDAREGQSHTWQIGLLAGPNLSTVNGSMDEYAGVNLGLVVRKKITKSRFSVETGFQVENLKYNLDTKGSKSKGSGNTSVIGKCLMLDIPLNLRIDLVQSKNGRAFVSTGVSGMMMTNERYVYVNNNNTSNNTYNYSQSQQTQQTAGSLPANGTSISAATNLSLGYERTFRRTSVQIEPYVKIPMGKMGSSDISLGSLGTQISIRQSF